MNGQDIPALLQRGIRLLMDEHLVANPERRCAVCGVDQYEMNISLDHHATDGAVLTYRLASVACDHWARYIQLDLTHQLAATITLSAAPFES